MKPIDPSKIELLDDATVAILRAKTPAERLAMAFECNRTTRLLIADQLRMQHPDWTDGQIQSDVARRMLVGQLKVLPYGPDEP